MANKVTEGNHLPGSGDGRFPVYSKQFNEAVDDFNTRLDDLEDGSITTTELTVDTLHAGDGLVGTPAVVIGDGETDTGLYKVSATQTGFAQDGALVATFDTYGMTADGFRPRITLETPNTGVTAFTYGDGASFTTYLTVAVTDAVTAADNAALASGYKLLDFPAGAIIVTDAYMSIGVTMAEDTTATPDVGIGTTIGAGVFAVLSDVGAGAENIITGQTAADANGTATVKTVVNQPLAIEAGDSHSVYLNIAATWADTAGVDLTGDIAGTVVIKWTAMALA